MINISNNIRIKAKNKANKTKETQYIIWDPSYEYGPYAICNDDSLYTFFAGCQILDAIEPGWDIS